MDEQKTVYVTPMGLLSFSRLLLAEGFLRFLKDVPPEWIYQLEPAGHLVRFDISKVENKAGIRSPFDIILYYESDELFADGRAMDTRYPVAVQYVGDAYDEVCCAYWRALDVSEMMESLGYIVE